MINYNSPNIIRKYEVIIILTINVWTKQVSTYLTNTTSYLTANWNRIPIQNSNWMKLQIQPTLRLACICMHIYSDIHLLTCWCFDVRGASMQYFVPWSTYTRSHEWSRSSRLWKSIRSTCAQHIFNDDEARWGTATHSSYTRAKAYLASWAEALSYDRFMACSLGLTWLCLHGARMNHDTGQTFTNCAHAARVIESPCASVVHSLEQL